MFISFDYPIALSALKKIDNMICQAKTHNSTVVLSIGLSPGLTNLLVQYSKSHLDTMDRAEISLMFGLGDSHGKAAIEWMTDNINTSYDVMEDGQPKNVKSFEDGRSTIFPEKYGRRTTYRLDFSDQHVVVKTLNLKSASTRSCFHSTFVTKLMFALKKIGFFKLLKFKSFKNIFMIMFNKFKMGPDIFIAKVDAFGLRNGIPKEYECSLSCRKEGLITGKVAALIAGYIYTEEFPSGVHHIEQLFDAEKVINDLGDNIKFYHN